MATDGYVDSIIDENKGTNLTDTEILSIFTGEKKVNFNGVDYIIPKTYTYSDFDNYLQNDYNISISTPNILCKDNLVEYNDLSHFDNNASDYNVITDCYLKNINISITGLSYNISLFDDTNVLTCENDDFYINDYNNPTEEYLAKILKKYGISELTEDMKKTSFIWFYEGNAGDTILWWPTAISEINEPCTSIIEERILRSVSGSTFVEEFINGIFFRPSFTETSINSIKNMKFPYNNFDELKSKLDTVGENNFGAYYLLIGYFTFDPSSPSLQEVRIIPIYKGTFEFLDGSKYTIEELVEKFNFDWEKILGNQ